jgi:integrase
MKPKKLPRGIQILDGHYHYSFTFKNRVTGESKRIKSTIAPVEVITVDDAVEARNQALAEAYRTGQALTAKEKRAKAEEERKKVEAEKILTVNELLDLFEKAHPKGTTRATAMVAYSRHLKALLGDTQLDHLSVVSLVAYRRSRLKQKIEVGTAEKRIRLVADATVTREVSALRSCVNWARSKKLAIGAEGSVFDFLTKADRRLVLPEENPAQPSRISDADLDAICAHLPQHVRAIPRLALLTGCRLMELIRLDWSEVDLQSHLPSIRPRRTKNKKARTIPLAPSAVALLPPRPAAGGTVFAGLGGKPLASFPALWVKARNAAGLPGTKFHSLRHEFASRWCEQGGDLRLLMAVGGWSSLDLITRYAKADLSRAIGIIEACQ